MNELIKVLTVTKSVDADGFDVESPVETELYCTVKSADYLDFYNANQSTVKPTIEFEMRREDFDECRITVNQKHFYPSIVIYDGARYDLVRWRYKDQEKAVMVCG